MQNNTGVLSKEMIGSLLREIKDKSLQNILRDVIFSDKDVFESVRYHRPEFAARAQKLKPLFRGHKYH